MSIRPVKLSPDGTIDVWHDEAGHGHTLSIQDIGFSQSAQGSINEDFLVIPCFCGSISVHPITGGSDPANIQALFVALKRHKKPKTSWQEAIDDVKRRIVSLEGEERIRLTREHEGDRNSAVLRYVLGSAAEEQRGPQEKEKGRDEPDRSLDQSADY
jgi:hypothetical protein